MAAHRYWRISVLSTWDSGNQVAIGEIEMRSAPDGSGSNLTSTYPVATTGTPSGSSAESGAPASNCFTSTTAYYWWSSASGTLPQWVQWDFTAGNEQDIHHVRIGNSNSHYASSAKDFTVDYSDDGSTWSVAYTGVTANATMGAYYAIGFVPTEHASAELAVPIGSLTAYTGATAELASPCALDASCGSATNLVSPMGTLRACCGAQASLTSPIYQVTTAPIATAHDSTGENGAALTMPAGVLAAATGAVVGLVSPSATLTTGATTTLFASAALVCPASVLSVGATVTTIASATLTLVRGFGSSYLLTAASGASAVLVPPSAAVSASATTGTSALVALTSPPATLTAFSGASAQLTAPSGYLNNAVKTGAVARAALTMPTAHLIGYAGAVCSVSMPLGKNVSAKVLTGAQAHGAVTLPMFELTAHATVETVAHADLLMPSPQMGTILQAWLTMPDAQLTAIGSAVVTATFEAYAINLNHTPRPGVDPVDEATHYTSFPFTHIVRYKNSYYGANSTGLYLLEDATVATDWAFKTGATDFKTTLQKTLSSMYVGGRLGAAATVTVYPGEDSATVYAYTTPRSNHEQNYRVPFARGVKARYWAVGASGAGELAVDNLELETHNMTRRI